MESEAITAMVAQFGGLGLFAILVLKTVSEAMKKIVESLNKMEEAMGKHIVALTQLAERTERIDRLLESRRDKRGVPNGGV